MPVWWRKTTTDPARADILPTGEKKVKKRYEWFDNAKGFLIYCVILGHVVERFLSRSWLAGRIQLWIYLFHMPAFVFLAGLFSKRAVMERRVDKALSYLFLFYFLKAAFYAAGIYVKGAENAEFLLFTESGIPWFCLAMCWWYLAAILTRSLSPAIVLTGSLVLSAITGYFPIDGSFLVLFRTFNFFPFFYLGYLTDPAQLRQLTQNKAARIAGALILTAAMGMCFLFYGKADKLLMLLRGRYRYEEIGKELCGIGGCFCRMTIFILSGIMILSFFLCHSTGKNTTCTDWHTNTSCLCFSWTVYHDSDWQIQDYPGLDALRTSVFALCTVQSACAVPDPAPSIRVDCSFYYETSGSRSGEDQSAGRL